MREVKKMQPSVLNTRHVPWTAFLNGVSTLNQYFILHSNGSKYYLMYTFEAVHFLLILVSGTSVLDTVALASRNNDRISKVPWDDFSNIWSGVGLGIPLIEEFREVKRWARYTVETICEQIHSAQFLYPCVWVKDAISLVFFPENPTVPAPQIILYQSIQEHILRSIQFICS